VAEYTGLIKALEWVHTNLEDRKIEILGDSQLVIRHITGEYTVRSSRIIPFYDKVCSLLKMFTWTARWIPRKENVVADELSLKAYNEYCVKNYGKVPLTMRQTGAAK
jgi:ribonuclease HI